MNRTERALSLRQQAVDSINEFCRSNNLDEYSAYLPTDIFVKDHNKVLIVHKTADDEHSFLMCAHDFKRGRRCPKCYGTPKKTLGEFKDEIRSLVGDEYSVISDEYLGNKAKLKFKHNICEREYEATPNKFLLGRRCPYCSINKSKAEEIIYKELLKNGLKENEIIRQKQFVDLKDTNFLRYDFYIEKVNLLLEFDGEQHYKPFRRADGIEKLEITKKHDQMKNEYALKKNINLVRIPYTKFNLLESEVKSICQRFKILDENNLLY